MLPSSVRAFQVCFLEETPTLCQGPHFLLSVFGLRAKWTFKESWDGTSLCPRKKAGGQKKPFRPSRLVSLFLCMTRDLPIYKWRAAQATRCTQVPDKLLSAAADKQSGLCGHRLSCVQAAQLKLMWAGFQLSSPVFSPYILPLPSSANWN